ncbi:Cytoplasmic tRNA 2-thiolation protein 2 [Sporothrix curviconia]|uniref:Cytoplasmic tRNA 2-thiolation protein 2 n=1 Tax=Sporothrix curviconia TaxID=1260050 RepID=A0ABP0BH56_9PEZI
MTQAGTAKQCRRCKDQEAAHTIRSDPICNDCFSRFVTTKTVKRLEVLNRETRSSQTGRPGGDGSSGSIRKFYAGLSFGPCSAALVDVCEQIILGRLSRGRDAAFTLHAVHIDTKLDQSGSEPLAEQRLDRWRTRYPRFTFERVPLSDVLNLDTVDWAALFPASPDDATASPPSTPLQLRTLLDNLPSATSRRDVLDLLVRRLLIARATSATETPPYDALLLGCSTTALAERTLAETAKGRGFSLPWQINDGAMDNGAGRQIPLYYPVRELFRNELVLYLNTVAQPPLTEGEFVLLPASATSSAAIVSHKDLSIEEVMTRYFAEVEANYPSIVANVVRTTAKLERHNHSHSHGHDHDHDHGEHTVTGCRVCGMPLDEAGNERWKGEIGHLDGPEGTPRLRVDRLCYGCERSIHG